MMTSPVAGLLGPSAGRGQRGKPLPLARVRPPGAFFRVPEVTFGCLVLTRPILQKSLFRKGEMAVLLLSGSWPELRIGPKTAAKKSYAYLGPVPSGVTTFWGAAKIYDDPWPGDPGVSCIDLILAKNH